MTDELRLAPALTPSLISRIISDSCTRLSTMARAGLAARLDRFVRAEAWMDAALSLIDLDLPTWRPRRLIYDGGEWICSLSRHPEIPIELDSTADGRHETQAIAILLSFIAAKRILATIEDSAHRHCPQATTGSAASTFCCDDFA
jgi:hypothetical protein